MPYCPKQTLNNAKQVSADVYAFETYCAPERWMSYYFQLREIFALKPTRMLEVGVGDGVVRSYLTQKTDIHYQSLDIAEDLHPDFVGSVTDIPLPDASVDCVCAFEVLEHLPFAEFPRALKELKRVSSKNVIISLPHFGPSLHAFLKLPLLPKAQMFWKAPFPKAHIFNGQHYWEIGKREYSVSRIRAILRTHFRLRKEFVPPESPYHHFFVLDVGQDATRAIV